MVAILHPTLNSVHRTVMCICKAKLSTILMAIIFGSWIMNELNGWMNEWMVTLSKTEETHETKWNDSQPASQPNNWQRNRRNKVNWWCVHFTLLFGLCVRVCVSLPCAVWLLHAALYLHSVRVCVCVDGGMVAAICRVRVFLLDGERIMVYTLPIFIRNSMFGSTAFVIATAAATLLLWLLLLLLVPLPVVRTLSYSHRAFSMAMHAFSYNHTPHSLHAQSNSIQYIAMHAPRAQA